MKRFRFSGPAKLCKHQWYQINTGEIPVGVRMGFCFQNAVVLLFSKIVCHVSSLLSAPHTFQNCNTSWDMPDNITGVLERIISINYASELWHSYGCSLMNCLCGTYFFVLLESTYSTWLKKKWCPCLKERMLKHLQYIIKYNTAGLENWNQFILS